MVIEILDEPKKPASDLVNEARALLKRAPVLPRDSMSIKDSPFWGYSAAIASAYADFPDLLSQLCDELDQQTSRARASVVPATASHRVEQSGRYAMPTDNTELTVEACLAELREMFPGEVFRIEVHKDIRMGEDGTITWRKDYACILQPSRGLDGFYNAPSLRDSLDKVREWKAQQ